MFCELRGDATQDASKRNARAARGGKIWIFSFSPGNAIYAQAYIQKQSPLPRRNSSRRRCSKSTIVLEGVLRLMQFFKFVTQEHFSSLMYLILHQPPDTMYIARIRVRSVACVQASFCSPAPAAGRGFPAGRLRGVGHCESRHRRWRLRRLYQCNRNVIWREVVSSIFLFACISHYIHFVNEWATQNRYKMLFCNIL